MVDKRQQVPDLTAPNSEGSSNNTATHPYDTNGLQEHSGFHKEYNGPSPLYPRVSFQLEEHHIDEPRTLRVVVIGAGLAGITAGILLPAKVPGIQLTIFEKNDDVVSFIRNYMTKQLLTCQICWNMVRKCLSWCSMRYTLSRLPVNLCSEYQLVRKVCPGT
jgi:hypothetical protein